MAATTTLSTLTKYELPITDDETLIGILYDLVRLYSGPDAYETAVISDRSSGHYLILDQGWDGFKQIHRTWVHVQIKDGKFWIHEDRTQDGIAVDLMNAGVPKSRIVLAFQHPSRRPYGEFAAE